MSTALSIGVSMDIGIHNDGRHVVVCDKIPMLLVAGDLDTAKAHVDAALNLVAAYLLDRGGDDASAYLRRRDVDYSFVEAESARSNEDRTFKYGGGVLAHA